VAARLTDKQKKKIVADYAMLGSYNAAAKANGVSPNTVKNIVKGNADFAQSCKRKKEENTQDILAYMDSQRSKVCDIIGLYLDELRNVRQFEKLTPNQLTTALGTLIDKWAMISSSTGNTTKEDGLSRSLRELAQELEGDD